MNERQGIVWDCIYCWPGSIRSLARATGLSHTTLLRCRAGDEPVSDNTLVLLRGACRKVIRELSDTVACVDDLGL